jgi:chlorobactene glucosyltransferase
MEQTILMLIADTILGILSAFLLVLIINLFTFYRLRTTTNAASRIMPSVSILVPARNEEHCIAACIHSLISQQYEHLEILVLDDQSSDATAAIVQHIIDSLLPAQQGRLRLLHGDSLPNNWIGKNFACYQLTKYAQNEYLFFTDADTIHAPETVKTVIGYMQSCNLQLLTAQPEHVLESLGELLVVPLLNFTILTLLPVALVQLRPEPSLAIGNGQLLCFHRSAYEAIGGHTAVKGCILEDVLLARAVKAAGYSMAFVDAIDLVRCRMYRSSKEVWTGFSKNLFAFYNYSLIFALLALILNLTLFVAPPLLILTALFIMLPPTLVVSASIAYALAVLMRILLTLRFARAKRALMLLLCLFHPISIVLECFILLNSIWWHYRKKGAMWKGRQYLLDRIKHA